MGADTAPSKPEAGPGVPRVARLDPTDVAATLQGAPPRAATRRVADVPVGEAGAADLADALDRLAGVHARSRGNFAQEAQVSIRGHGARANFGLRGLRLVVDGVPASAADGQGQLGPFEPWLYDRVELIAGPAALLYGNASGGVLRVQQRVFDAWQAEADFAAGQRGLFVAGPWSREASASSMQLAFGDWRGEGARPHSASRRRSLSLHGEHLVSPSLTLDWQFSASDAPQADDPLGLTMAQFRQDPFAASPNALAFDTRKSSSQWQAAARAARQQDDASHVVSAWTGQRRIEQFLAVPMAAQSNPRSGGGVIDLERGFGGIEWTGTLRRERWQLAYGVRGEMQRDARRGFENFLDGRVGVRGALRRDEVLRVRSLDPMASLDVDLGASWRGFAGVRGTRLRFEVDDAYIAPGNPDDGGRRRFSSWSPAAGLSFRHANWLFRGSIGRGFESPTGNELAYRADGEGGLNLDLRPARSRLHELAADYAVAGWSWSATLFHEQVRDEIVVAQSSGGRSVFRNAGRTRRRGVETQIDWAPAEGWSMTLAHTLLDARFRDSPEAGHRLPGVPRQWGTLRAQWSPLSREDLSCWAGLHFASGVAVDDANTQHTSGWQRVDVGVSRTVQTRLGDLRMSMAVENVFDRTYAGSVIVNEANGRFLETARPRTFGAGIAWTWR
ncbi:MAG: TonB-dependent receptor [Xanthomonadales bacterium]|nr:TonB-dependent receptor [Xanthomonadales bacterium]